MSTNKLDGRGDTRDKELPGEAGLSFERIAAQCSGASNTNQPSSPKTALWSAGAGVREPCPMCGGRKQSDHAWCNRCWWEARNFRIVGLACDRFFVKRGLSFDFKESLWWRNDREERAFRPEDKDRSPANCV